MTHSYEEKRWLSVYEGERRVVLTRVAELVVRLVAMGGGVAAATAPNAADAAPDAATAATAAAAASPRLQPALLVAEVRPPPPPGGGLGRGRCRGRRCSGGGVGREVRMAARDVGHRGRWEREFLLCALLVRHVDSSDVINVRTTLRAGGEPSEVAAAPCGRTGGVVRSRCILAAACVAAAVGRCRCGGCLGRRRGRQVLGARSRAAQRSRDATLREGVSRAGWGRSGGGGGIPRVAAVEATDCSYACCRGVLGRRAGGAHRHRRYRRQRAANPSGHGRRRRTAGGTRWLSQRAATGGQRQAGGGWQATRSGAGEEVGLPSQRPPPPRRTVRGLAQGSAVMGSRRVGAT